MLGEQQRNEEAERVLHRLGRRKAQGLALPERIERQEKMHQESAVDRRAAEPAGIDAIEVPHRVLGQIERDEAKGVIEEVTGHEGEHDQSRD